MCSLRAYHPFFPPLTFLIYLSYFPGRYANDTHTTGIQRKKEAFPLTPPSVGERSLDRYVKYSKYLSLRFFD